MKKLIFLTLLAAASASVFAADEKKPADGSKSISYIVLNQFSAEFTDAKDIQWTVEPQFQKAKFLLDGEKLTAYYSLTGDYLGATKFVSIEQIPAKAKAELSKKFAEYTVSHAIQVVSRPVNSEGSDTGSYWIDLVTENKEIYAKVSSYGVLETVKKIK